MCRLMLDRLGPDDLVLDVGVGSGVLGIWAAKKRRCRVVGIDVSRRAVRFTADNAEKNDIRRVAQPQKLRGGDICLFCCSFEDFVRKQRAFLLQFDMVFLNPPFNPTCPLITPALHANAGPDAQRPFKSQIALVPRIQKNGGYCIGYQMSYDPCDGKSQALSMVRQAYGGRCRIAYANVLRDSRSIAVEAFLREQYSTLLAEGGRRGTSVERYIKRVGGKGECFSLIYYEVRKEDSVVPEMPVEVSVSALPSKTWRDRIWLHRCIAEHSARRR